MGRFRFPQVYARAVARWRVAAGLVLAVALAWLARPSWASLLCGLPWMLAGLILRAWAAGHLIKNQVLATGGPYAYMRNPLYAGTAAVAVGLVIASRRLLLAVLFASFFLLIYLPVIEQEEQHLRALFPDYEAYAARVPRWLPRSRTQSAAQRFSWQLYRRNREYQALLAWLVGMVWLAYRAARG